MNFLGHAYFTKGDEEELAGNLFGDFVKGNIDSHPFPEGIKRGLKYHRRLDSACNETQGYQLLKKLLQGEFRHYRGVITDIFIDHLLSVYWKDFSAVSLEEFATGTYQRVVLSRRYFPEKFARLFEYMERDNWFVRNRDLNTIENILKSIERRSNKGIEIHHAIKIIQQQPSEFRERFYIFMEEMKTLLK